MRKAHAVSMAFAVASVAALVPLHAVAGARVDEIFQRANEAYYGGNYETAIARYERLVEAGIEDPDVYYNLATTYAHAGHYGRAILHFERTLQLRPGDEEAERGLTTAREELAKRRIDKGEAIVQADRSLGESLVEPFSVSALAWILVVADVLFFGILLARRFVRAEAGRLALAIAAPFAALSLVLFASGLAIKTGALRDGTPAVVLEHDAPVREGPDPRAARRARAQEGERARLLERQDDFVRVRLRGDRVGWMRVDDVEAI